jgi:hypothetical protein
MPFINYAHRIGLARRRRQAILDAYGTEIVADNPVAWYRFRDDSEVVGSTISDSKNSYDFDFTATDAVLTLQAGGPTGGKYGEYTTNGSDSPVGISIPQMDSSNVGGTGYTIEFFIKENFSGPFTPVGSNGAPDEILHCSGSYDGTDITINHNWFGNDLSGTTQFGIGSGWRHIVLTWDPSGNTRSTYIDSSLIDSDSPGDSPAWDDSVRVLSETSVNIAELTYYNYPLSSTRILAHYNAA